MQVKRFINTILSSNSYIIYSKENNVWIVDPGDSDQILEWLKINNKYVEGILLTHYHIDHIYGVNDLKKAYPDLKIFSSKKSLEGLYSAKLNGSCYLEMPYVIEDKQVDLISEDFVIDMHLKGTKVRVFNTPGHNNDCVSYSVNDYLFTGDSLIPGNKVHIKSKYSSKALAEETIIMILKTFSPNTIICPGHKAMRLLKDIEISEILRS